ncbi:helix-turn-helix domain-containing protein [Listeria cossartiae]|uniref:helix-turn-helix domain-containing protein n=1 Tax=Listeria cossartiae TaxID=2838249 RepID=UPI001E2D6455|nr:helix-turn-helix transcriptional regulator [Listeria cossartiae]MCD2223234.1 helix-turn-helix domain-containing protein [Listeria cossartiae]MCD2237913.1 helix-turn-helix domain-containing protein [Listeria cossartiae]
MEIYERIVQLRTKKSISQKDLAKKINIDDSTMNKIEKGNRPIRDKELAKIADVLEVSTDYLLGRSTDKFIDTIAAHINTDATEEELREAFAYIEEKRKEIAKDKKADNYIEESDDIKAIAARMMDDEEAARALKAFLKIYDQQKND